MVICCASAPVAKRSRCDSRVVEMILQIFNVTGKMPRPFLQTDANITQRREIVSGGSEEDGDICPASG